MTDQEFKLCFDKNGHPKSGYSQKQAIKLITDYNTLCGSSFSEKLYCFKYQITPPTCICGKPLKYYNYEKGYYQYCSEKCRSNDPKYKEQFIPGFKQKETQNKIKKVIKEKYGVDNIGRLEATKEKIITKLRIKAQQFRNSQEYVLKTRQMIEILGYQVLQTTIVNEETHYTLYCNKHNYTWTWDRLLHERDFVQLYPYCKHCHNEKRSGAEVEIAEFVKSIYSGPIIENDKQTLKNKELDIFLPELKLAIEYNGTYWHSYNRYKETSLKEYSQKSEQKRLECQKLGIRLITIDECDYLLRPEVFKRFLKDAVMPRIKLYGRSCEIAKIDTKTAKDFCEYYHVNGFRGGSFKYGLFYKNDLVAVAVFAKYKSNYECIRLCYKTGINIIGGWAKIQKHFGKRFIHYVNLKYFAGENKTGCGFRFVLKNGNVLHRNALQKKTGLYKYCKKVDTQLSDFDNCINNGLLCITDVGNDIRWYN